MRFRFVEAGVIACVAIISAAAAADSVTIPVWGESGAKPEPQLDRGTANCPDEARASSWWWPKPPASSGDDTVWGNRGVVFHAWAKQEKSLTIVCPPIPPTPASPVCWWPVFNNILFDLNKAVLGPEDIPILDQTIAAFRERPESTVILEGHACDMGSPEPNMALGLRRAETVKRYMVEHGIVAARIGTKSYGDTDPAVPNDSEVNRKLNRRVNFNFSPSVPCATRSAR